MIYEGDIYSDAGGFLAPRYPAADIERALAAFADQGLSELPQAAADSARLVANRPWELFAQLAIRQTKVLTMEESSETAAVSPRFTSCEFHVEEFPGARLVQGDTPVVFHGTNGQGFTPILHEGEEFDFAYLPLTSTKVLIVGKGRTPKMAWRELQAASIASAYEHFIAAEPYPELNGLLGTVGDAFPSFSDEHIEQMFSEVLEKAMTEDWLDGEWSEELKAIASQVLPPPPGTTPNGP